jgi:subtilisin family serine protease
MKFINFAYRYPKGSGTISRVFLALALLLACQLAAANWMWDQNGSGIDDRIEAVESLGLIAAVEKGNLLEGRLTFAVHEVNGVFRYPVYVGYEYHPGDEDIQRLVDSGVSSDVLHPYQIIDYIRMELTFDEIQTVAGLPGVRRVESIPLLYPMNNNATRTSGVKESGFMRFPSVHEHLNITGRGVVVSILDTGVNDAHDPLTGYPGHESLIGKFVAGGTFFAGEPLLNTGLDESENPIDRGEGSTHGTHVAGTAIGTGGPSGFFGGVAPGASLVDQKVLSDAGVGFGSADGVEWAVVNKDRYNIRILNLSLGGLNNSDGTDAGSQAINAAFDAGLLAAIAMGNDGEIGYVSSPAAADKAVSIGAIQDQNTISRHDDVIADFSNEGPRLDDGTGRVEPRMKPIVAAPGAGVVSADGSLISDGRQYQSLSGTSMATPVVAGIMALILEANPDLTPAEVVEILKHTAEHRNDWGKTPADFNPFPDADPNYHPSGGWGYADAYAAVKEALRLAGDPASQVQVVQIGGVADVNGEAAIHFGWISQREIELDGYNVYRAEDINGSPGAFVQINDQLIEGVGQAQIEQVNNRNEYVFTDDNGLQFGKTYWYQVEHVSAAGTFAEPAYPVTLGEEVPVARLKYSITHNAIDNDLLVLLGTGTQVARAEFIVTGRSAAEADEVTTVAGDPTTGNLRHDFTIELTSRHGVADLLPPGDHQRWFLSVNEGGFVNRSGRVEAFSLEILDADGNVVEVYTTGDVTPQPTVEGLTTELWIPDNPEVVLPGDSPAVVEADPGAAVQGTETIEVGIFGAKFLPLAEVEVGGTGVEVVSSSVVSGSEISATLSVASDAATGPRDIIVTNLDGQADIGHGLFTVISADDEGNPGEPEVVVLDDADPAIEYTGGWHRRESDDASSGGYHRRMGGNGQGSGSAPTARLVFSGDQITYFYGTSDNGGSADVFINGELAATVSYRGSAHRNAPDFTESITFDELGNGEHEIRIVHRSGAVYVDGFRIVSNGSGDQADANEQAVQSRSITEIALIEAPAGLFGLLATVAETTLELAASDRGISIEIEDAASDLAVLLIDPFGDVVGSAVRLLDGSDASMFVLDAPVNQAGSYVLRLSSVSGLTGSYQASVAREVAVNQ